MANVGKTNYLPPPVGGINGIDPYYDMPERDCVLMENLAPKESYLEVRKGFELLGSSAAIAGMTDSAKISALTLPSGVTTFFCQTIAANYFTVSTSGVFSLTAALSYDVNVCQFGAYLFGAGGGAGPIRYDGSTLVGASWTGSGLTNTKLESPFPYNGRLYFCEKDTANIWYGEPDQIDPAAYALTKLNLTSQLHKGGYLMFGSSSMPQEGKDLDSFFVVISNMGEILIYTGADPSVSDGSWKLFGRYSISPPLSRRSFFHIGGVLHIQTRTGIYAINDIIQGKKEGAMYSSISRKIDPLLTKAFNKTSSGTFGRGAISPRENLLYIPIYESGVGSFAYVMNLITGSWSKYTIYSDLDPALTRFYFIGGFCEVNNDMYFLGNAGPSSKIALWKVGQDYLYDKFGATEADIKDIHWSVQHAFSQSGVSNNKKFNKIRPIVMNQSSIKIGSYTDFQTTLSSQTVTTNLTINNKFYDINKEAPFLSVYIAGDSNDTSATALPQYHGSILSYQIGSDIP